MLPIYKFFYGFKKESYQIKQFKLIVIALYYTNKTFFYKNPI